MSQTAKSSRASDSSKTKQANEASAQEAEAQARAKKERLVRLGWDFAGLVLLVLGALLLLAVLGITHGRVVDAGATLLRRWFGVGRFLVAVAIFAAGWLLLLWRKNQARQVNIIRVILLEIAFFLLLGAFSALSNDTVSSVNATTRRVEDELAVWLRLDGSLDPRSEAEVSGLLGHLDNAETQGAVILSSVTLAEELDRLQTNPLGLGLLGLMYLAFIMALALSVVGLLTYSGLTAQARRSEFGVLRALGLSSVRVVAGLALEQAFVMVIGVTLGAVLGAVLANQVVPTLALGATGENVVPPFVMRVELRRFVEYGLMMAVVLGLVLSSSLLLVRQLSLARTLRLGDE